MPIIKNGKNVTAIYKGTTPIAKIYKGLQVVWEAFKNLIVSGVPPLTLTGSIGKPMVDYKIDGNSIQASEATLTAPVEVESVGDKTYNLVSFFKTKILNGVTATVNQGVITLNGTCTGTVNFEVQCEDVEMGEYSLVDFAQGVFPNNGYARTQVLFGDEYINTSNNSKSNYVVNKTLTQKTECKLRIRVVEGFTYENCVLKPMLIKGTYTSDTIPEYKPAGYEIPIIVEPKNLFDRSRLTRDYNYTKRYGEYGIQTIKPSSGNRGFYFPVDIKKDVTYTISFKLVDFGGDANRGYVRFRNSDGVSIQSNGFVFNGLNKIYSANFTAEEDLAVAEFYSQTVWEEGSYYTIDEIMISKLSDKVFEPYFEPITTSIYLDEPLRKIGTYNADYIDFANKKVVRNINQITYTGEETFIDFDSNVFTTTTITKGLKASNDILLCNTCIPARATTLGWRNNSVNSFQINKSWIGATTVDELKTVLEGLSEQLKIYYVLANPTEETIELPTIPTGKNTNIISVDTTIQPSNMEVTYKGK